MQKTAPYEISIGFFSCVSNSQIESGMQRVWPQLEELWKKTSNESFQIPQAFDPSKGVVCIVPPKTVLSSFKTDFQEIFKKAFGSSNISIGWPALRLRGNWLPEPLPQVPDGCFSPGATLCRDPKAYGDSKAQANFALWFEETVIEIADHLKQETTFSLWSLLCNIGKKRQAIAKELQQQAHDRYGEPRHLTGLLDCITSLSLANYPDYHERFNQEFQNPPSWCNQLSAFPQRLPAESSYLSGLCFVIEHPLPHKTESSILTAICSGSEINANAPVIFHTRGIEEADKEQTLTYLQGIVYPLLSKGSCCEKGETLRILAEVHWWLAQLTLFCRGSAAISEIFVQAVARAVGFPHSAWAPKIMPDIEAMYRPLQEFIKIYPRILYLEKDRVGYRYDVRGALSPF